MISLEKPHNTKREASAMLADIVEKMQETVWIRTTIDRVGMAPQMYEVVKVGRKWRIKATQAHLDATQKLHKINNQPNL